MLIFMAGAKFAISLFKTTRKKQIGTNKKSDSLGSLCLVIFF